MADKTRKSEHKSCYIACFVHMFCQTFFLLPKSLGRSLRVALYRAFMTTKPAFSCEINLMSGDFQEDLFEHLKKFLLNMKFLENLQAS